MSERIDAKLKQLARENNTEIPSLVRARMEETLAALPEKAGQLENRAETGGMTMAGGSAGSDGVVGSTSAGRRRAGGKRLRRVAVALVAVIGVYASGFLSPTMADVLSKIPLIGTPFEDTGDSGVQQAYRDGYAMSVDQQAADKGITLKIDNVIYDGQRLSFGVLGQFPNEKDGEPGITDMTVELPGTVVTYRPEPAGQRHADPMGWHKVDDHLFAGVFTFDPPKREWPDSFEASIVITKVGEIEGNWAFRFPVSIDKTKADSRTVTVQQTKQADSLNVTLEALHFTPTQTTIDLKYESPRGIEFDGGLLSGVEVLDDKGQPLPSLLDGQGAPITGSLSAGSESANKVDVRRMYAPIKELPRHVIVRVNNDPRLAFKIQLN